MARVAGSLASSEAEVAGEAEAGGTIAEIADETETSETDERTFHRSVTTVAGSVTETGVIGKETALGGEDVHHQG